MNAFVFVPRHQHHETGCETCSACAIILFFVIVVGVAYWLTQRPR